MGLISGVEDAILAEVVAALERTVSKVETIPGGWTMDALTRALQFAPGVYCAFLGTSPGQNEGYHTGRFTVYLVSKGASETDRRRGNSRVIGAYDMLERLLPRLDGLDIPEVGRLRVSGVENLFRDALFDLGGTVYGITMNLPNMPFVAFDGTALDLFDTFHADLDQAPADGAIDAVAHETNLYT